MIKCLILESIGLWFDYFFQVIKATSLYFFEYENSHENTEPVSTTTSEEESKPESPTSEFEMIQESELK